MRHEAKAQAGTQAQAKAHKEGANQEEAHQKEAHQEEAASSVRW